MDEFIKQFSNLPKKFIDDFYVIAKKEYNEDELIINFDLVYNWLETRKHHLKKVLVDNFEENYDYIIKINNVKQPSGNGVSMRHDIFITPNCFKELCMISQTARAKEVRKYFIEMEKIVKRYHTTIKEEMYKQIGILEKNQKPKLDVKGGIIYILEAQNSTTTLYKLGKTEDLKNRIENYNTGNANDVEPIFILKVNDVDSVENCIKNACKKYQYRKHKEIYQIDIDVLKEVIYKCDDLMKFVEMKDNKKTKKERNNAIKRMKNKESNYFVYIAKE